MASGLKTYGKFYVGVNNARFPQWTLARGWASGEATPNPLRPVWCYGFREHVDVDRLNHLRQNLTPENVGDFLVDINPDDTFYRHQIANGVDVLVPHLSAWPTVAEVKEKTIDYIVNNRIPYVISVNRQLFSRGWDTFLKEAKADFEHDTLMAHTPLLNIRLVIGSCTGCSDMTDLLVADQGFIDSIRGLYQQYIFTAA